jgi:putative ABC transport system ATP-binding protein
MNKIIQFNNIIKEYDSGNGGKDVILKGLSFDIEEGDFVAITGPSGSGKSTCMNIIGCLDLASSGQYILNGHDVSNLSNDELANIRNEFIGFVFQSYNLLARRNLLDNISLPLVYRGIAKKERYEKAAYLLEKVNLKGYENHYPTQLSGGMKQRVAIARALVGDPKIILTDEATASLDTKTSYEIMDLLIDLNKKNQITIIMVTHEPDIAAMARRIIKIRDGIINN